MVKAHSAVISFSKLILVLHVKFLMISIKFLLPSKMGRRISFWQLLSCGL